jgi:hypothetical protein
MLDAFVYVQVLYHYYTVGIQLLVKSLNQLNSNGTRIRMGPVGSLGNG